VTIEMGADGSNMDALQHAMADSLRPPTAAERLAAEEAKAFPFKPAPPKAWRFAIGRLIAEGGTVRLANPVPSGPTSGPLGRIDLTRIGGITGIDPKSVARLVLGAIASQATAASAGLGANAGKTAAPPSAPGGR
jgi:hypothetical protein